MAVFSVRHSQICLQDWLALALHVLCNHQVGQMNLNFLAIFNAFTACWNSKTEIIPQTQTGLYGGVTGREFPVPKMMWTRSLIDQ